MNESLEQPELPQVAGRRIATSNERFERSALVCLMREQDEMFPDNALISVLCEAVRLVRQYTDHAGARETKELIDELQRQLAAEREARERAECRVREMSGNYDYGAQVLNEVLRILHATPEVFHLNETALEFTLRSLKEVERLRDAEAKLALAVDALRDICQSSPPLGSRKAIAHSTLARLTTGKDVNHDT